MHVQADFVCRAGKQNKHCRISRDGRLYLMGTAQFESLVDLVEHFEKVPLYRKVKLKYPITDELIRRVELDNGAQVVSFHIVQYIWKKGAYCLKIWIFCMQDQTGDSNMPSEYMNFSVSLAIEAFI